MYFNVEKVFMPSFNRSLTSARFILDIKTYLIAVFPVEDQVCYIKAFSLTRNADLNSDQDQRITPVGRYLDGVENWHDTA